MVIDQNNSDMEFQEILFKISVLSSFIPELKHQLYLERENPPASKEDIELKIFKAQMELDKLDLKLVKSKKAVKKRKKEVDEWKRWYSSIPTIDKSEHGSKLSVEISWRSEEIANREKAIAALESTRLSALGKLEKLKSQLDAFLEGVYKLPLEADPRLIEANKELAMVREELQKLQSVSKSL